MVLLDGLTSTTVDTPRLRQRVLRREASVGAPVPLLLVHGNVSSALCWQPLMVALPDAVDVIAVDLRGFGDTETAPVDATRGLADFADDVAALITALELPRPWLAGWSMGGGVVLQHALDHPEQPTAGLVLQAPVSPYGFGGTAADGSPLTPDGAGTGGGGANPDFVARLRAGDRGEEAPTSPRAVYRAAYVHPGFASPHEDSWVEAMLSTATGEDNYPGDARPSEAWPGFAAGDRGVLNTMAPTHLDLSGIVALEVKPPILWVRGDQDLIVSDTSFFDLNHLGALGAVPGWPGAEVAPAQPMVSQTRDVLERYAAAGGAYEEVVLAGCGHSPHLEQPAEFLTALRRHLGVQSARRAGPRRPAAPGAAVAPA